MKIKVMLTDSENEYLKYPCEGLLNIIEVGTEGRVIVAVFQRKNESGALSCPVEVKKPKFSYA